VLFERILAAAEYFHLTQIPGAKPRALLEFFAYLVLMSLIKKTGAEPVILI